MTAGDEDALICDFAEYYHVLEWRGLPLTLAATLAFGLPEGSRSKRRLSGSKIPLETRLLARITDYLAVLLWRQTKDGQEGNNPPRSLEAILDGTEARETQKPSVYRSGEEFMRAYHQFTGEEDE